MGSLIGAGLGLAAEIFKFLNQKEATKYIDRCVKLQLEIKEEEEKPYDQQNDAKIVSLRKEAIILMEAAKAQLEQTRAGKPI